MSKNKQQTPDIREMLSGIGGAASQAQSRVAKEQAETYRKGPWWNFLQFTGMRCPEGIRGPESLFEVARAAMSMQCMMYGGKVVERRHNLKCSREDLDEFAKNNKGRLMYVLMPQAYLYVFPRGVVYLDCNSAMVLTSDSDLTKNINEFLEGFVNAL